MSEVDLSFEAALERLERLVGKLEGGELTLEDSLQTFEQGATLIRHCCERLEAAELRISELEPGRAEPVERPLDVETDE